MNDRIRVLIVDDSRDVAEVMAKLIDRAPGLAWAGSLHTAQDLAGEVVARKADVVLVDLTMPGSSPLHAIREVRAECASCRVVVMSGYDDADTVDMAMRAGASAFVSKHGDPMKIVEALRAV